MLTCKTCIIARTVDRHSPASSAAVNLFLRAVIHDSHKFTCVTVSHQVLLWLTPNQVVAL